MRGKPCSCVPNPMLDTRQQVQEMNEVASTIIYGMLELHCPNYVKSLWQHELGGSVARHCCSRHSCSRHLKNSSLCSLPDLVGVGLSCTRTCNNRTCVATKEAWH